MPVCLCPCILIILGIWLDGRTNERTIFPLASGGQDTPFCPYSTTKARLRQHLGHGTGPHDW